MLDIYVPLYFSSLPTERISVRLRIEESQIFSVSCARLQFYTTNRTSGDDVNEHSVGRFDNEADDSRASDDLGLQVAGTVTHSTKSTLFDDDNIPSGRQCRADNLVGEGGRLSAYGGPVYQEQSFNIKNMSDCFSTEFGIRVLDSTFLIISPTSGIVKPMELATIIVRVKRTCVVLNPLTILMVVHEKAFPEASTEVRRRFNYIA